MNKNKTLVNISLIEDEQPLSSDQCNQYLSFLNSWSITQDNKLINEFTFNDFDDALKFINEIGEIAEQAKHHPDIFLHNWNKVTVTLQTHTIQRLSIKDFEMASLIDSYIIEKSKTKK